MIIYLLLSAIIIQWIAFIWAIYQLHGRLDKHREAIHEMTVYLAELDRVLNYTAHDEVENEHDTIE